MSVCLSVFLSVFLYITRLGVLSRIKWDLSCPLYRYRYIRRYSLGRSLLWHKLVIGLKLIKGEYCHINKCWTLISTGRPRCPTSLYWVNIDINSNILILQCLPLRSILQFDSVLWTDYFYQRRAPELAPISYLSTNLYTEVLPTTHRARPSSIGPQALPDMMVHISQYMDASEYYPTW